MNPISDDSASLLSSGTNNRLPRSGERAHAKPPRREEIKKIRIAETASVSKRVSNMSKS